MSFKWGVWSRGVGKGGCRFTSLTRRTFFLIVVTGILHDVISEQVLLMRFVNLNYHIRSAAEFFAHPKYFNSSWHLQMWEGNGMECYYLPVCQHCHWSFLYEAASMDGAVGQRLSMLHCLELNLPSRILPLLMNVGNVLNVGFGNEICWVMDLYRAYRRQLIFMYWNGVSARWLQAFGTAVGIFKSSGMTHCHCKIRLQSVTVRKGCFREVKGQMKEMRQKKRKLSAADKILLCLILHLWSAFCGDHTKIRTWIPGSVP